MMRKCSEERQKLAAEWAEFHTQQQLSKERMERDMDRALQMDSKREGTIMSLAKVGERSPFPWPPALPGRLTDGSCPQGRCSELPEVFEREMSLGVARIRLFQQQPPPACCRC